MFKINFKIREGLFGTIVLILIFPLNYLLTISLPFSIGFFDKIAPLYFANLLLVPYTRKESTVIGTFLGFVVYSIFTSLPIYLLVTAGIMLTLVFTIYNWVFYKEPEKISHILVNVLLSFLVAIFSAWILALLNSVTFYDSFQSSFNAYLFGSILGVIIINVITYFYGVKFYGETAWLRK